MATGSNIYGYKNARFPNGIATDEMDALDGTTEIDMEGNEINFIATSVLVNGAPIGGGTGVQNPMTSALNMGGFDIVDVGLSLNAINTKTQNLSAVGSVSTLNGDVIIQSATIPLTIDGSIVQQLNSSEFGCISILENKKTGGVLDAANIGAIVARAYNNTATSITVGSAGFSSTQNHTIGSSGTDFIVFTTPQNTATATERLRIGSDNTTVITGNLDLKSLNTSTKLITVEADFGTPTGNFYVLADDVNYRIQGTVAMTYGLQMGLGNSICGDGLNGVLSFDETSRNCQIKSTLGSDVLISDLTIINGGGRFSGLSTLGLFDCVDSFQSFL